MEIPITKVVFDAEERRLGLQPLKTEWVTQGPFVRRFEERIADFTGAAHAVATSSCTGAMHVALHALDVGPGDEVIVPAFSFVATANVVCMTGARPVFCDIDLETFNLDPRALDRLVTSRTRVILPVHEFGLAADMESILEVARAHDLLVLEDAACAIGTRVHDRHVGRFGRAGCFSFHPRKTLTTGQGGMLVTDDARMADRARTIRRHGLDIPDPLPDGVHDGFLVADARRLGFNYQMSDMQGALGVAQMGKADDILAKRRHRAHRYDDLLADIAQLACPPRRDDGSHSYQSYTCLYRREEATSSQLDRLYDRRNQLMRALEERGVATRQGGLALPRLAYYRDRFGVDPADFAAALAADRLSLSLPLYAQMTDEEQDYVVTALKETMHAQQGA